MPFDAEPIERTPLDRLELVARSLDGVPEEHLDLHHWSCGSVACALGWGIRRYGAELNMSIGQIKLGGVETDIPFIGDSALLKSEDFDWAALGSHFGISATTASRLFGGARRDYRELSGEDFVTVEVVQRVIRQVIDEQVRV